jgi:hypothetical protein
MGYGKDSKRVVRKRLTGQSTEMKISKKGAKTRQKASKIEKPPERLRD